MKDKETVYSIDCDCDNDEVKVMNEDVNDNESSLLNYIITA